MPVGDDAALLRILLVAQDAAAVSGGADPKMEAAGRTRRAGGGGARRVPLQRLYSLLAVGSELRLMSCARQVKLALEELAASPPPPVHAPQVTKAAVLAQELGQRQP
jgi:hypothetical protein